MGPMYEIGRWREQVERGLGWGIDFRLDPEKTALVLVDIQRKTCDPHSPRGMSITTFQKFPEVGRAYFDRLEKVVLPNVLKVLGFFRERNLKVVHFLVGPALPDASDLPFAFRMVSQKGLGAKQHGVIHKGTAEYCEVDGVRPREGEPVIDKVTMSGFVGTGADLLLRNMGIDSIVLVGGHTHACVESTGRVASDLGYKVVVLEDAVINLLPLSHDAAMINFASFIGRVMTTDEVIRELS